MSSRAEQPSSVPLLGVVGPTATGKTELSLRLAGEMGAEIVSVDSMVVYRGMDVGTAKPTPPERARIPHHLIDLVDPSAPFSVAAYQALGRSALRDVRARGRRALLTGGSGLYFRALVDDLEFPGTDPRVRSELEREGKAIGAEALYRRLVETDPQAAAKIEPANLRRIVRALEVPALTGRRFSEFAAAWDVRRPEAVRVAGIDQPREILAVRIERRIRAMVERDWIAEVRGLMEQGFGAWLTATQAIGYAELAQHLDGEFTLEEAVDRTVRRTKNLARRQMAWFRRDPRIRWFPVGSGGAIEALDGIEAYLKEPG